MLVNFSWENHKFACIHTAGIDDSQCKLRDNGTVHLGLCEKEFCPTFNIQNPLKKMNCNCSRTLTVESKTKNGNAMTMTSTFISGDTLSQVVNKAIEEGAHLATKIKMTIK